jgi:hypothetical protein
MNRNQKTRFEEKKAGVRGTSRPSRPNEGWKRTDSEETEQPSTLWIHSASKNVSKSSSTRTMKSFALLYSTALASLISVSAYGALRLGAMSGALSASSSVSDRSRWYKKRVVHSNDSFHFWKFFLKGLYFFLPAPSFVPRSHGVISSSPKNVIASKMRGSNRGTITMMPIGVPKVAYRVPGSQSADW